MPDITEADGRRERCAADASEARASTAQRSTVAMFASSWRSPAAGVRLFSRSTCSELNSSWSAAVFSSGLRGLASSLCPAPEGRSGCNLPRNLSPPLKHSGALILANRPEQHRRPRPRNVRRSPGEVREGIGEFAGELKPDRRLRRNQPTEPAGGSALGSGIALMEHQHRQRQGVFGVKPAELSSRSLRLDEASPLDGAAEASERGGIDTTEQMCA
jgi:hypothetical protein